MLRGTADNMWFLIHAVLLLCDFSEVSSMAVFREPTELSSFERSFMKRFGYLPRDEGNHIHFGYTPHSISQALIRLQHFAGIPQTGELDQATKQLFVTRRCGNKDIEESPYRRRRYALEQPWNKKVITYKVRNGSSTLSKEQIEEVMDKSFAMWAQYGDLTFIKVDPNAEADIKITFYRGEHGDESDFDGPGKVVGHAFPPPYGDIHFDDDEIWGEYPSGTPLDDMEDFTDLLPVAVHEIGHALGLSHSTVKNSIMYPYYKVPFDGIGADDIEGMRALYLQNKLPSEAPLAITVVTESSRSSYGPRITNSIASEEDDVPDLCFTNYDTIQVLFGKICVFEEEWIWMLSDKKQVMDGFPKKFHDVFIGLPKSVVSIKAVYENIHGRIVIFSGKKFWEFDNSYRLVGKGSLKKFKIPKYVRELTTAFRSNFNNKTYLVAEERFWRYDEVTSKMDPGYPKSMSAWRNITYPVDAALIWEEDTYFFRGPRFWRFDNSLVAAHNSYPVPTAQVWFPCPDNEDMYLFIVNED